LHGEILCLVVEFFGFCRFLFVVVWFLAGRLGGLGGGGGGGSRSTFPLGLRDGRK